MEINNDSTVIAPAYHQRGTELQSNSCEPSSEEEKKEMALNSNSDDIVCR